MKIRTTCTLLALAVLIAGTTVHGQQFEGYEFLAPRPGASFVPSQSGIVLRPGGILLSTAEEIAALIAVSGEISGRHTGNVTIALDGKTAIFTPTVPFTAGEKVIVEVADGLRIRGEKKERTGISFGFHVSSDANRRNVRTYLPDVYADKLDAVDLKMGDEEKANVIDNERPTSSGSKSVAALNLPSDFPVVEVLANDNPSDGYVFLAPFSWSASLSTPKTPYLLILDNSGSPVFFKRLQSACYDFKAQPNGHLTYFDNDPFAQGYIELDSTYKRVNIWRMGNGYGTDLHDIQLLPNGHALTMSYDLQTIDMSQHVPGGREDASVVGYVMQELDAGHNVVFEWRSWDHFQFTDAAESVDLTAGYIDYVHGNAIEVDRDGHLLISSRHMDEITKVNRQTGEIIWRLGGENNEFTFINDPTQFTHQHDIRRLPNGNISLFDNGNRHVPQRSRAVEYAIDEVNKTVTLVWEYPESSTRYSAAMGNAQRLPDGNTMIGWGFVTEGMKKNALSEVRPDGSVAFELLTDTNVVTYRAFRFPWNGKSSAPYLWTEDAIVTMADTVVLNMTVFGRDDIQEYAVLMADADWPPPSEVAGVTSGNEIVVRGLERGKTYRFEAIGKSNDGKETLRSEQVQITTLPVGPVARVNLSTIAVGNAAVGNTRQVSFPALISNIGEEPLEVSSIEFGGNDRSDFQILSGGGPFTLAPGATQDVVVLFTPSRLGAIRATLDLKSNAVNDTAISLAVRGTGVSPAVAGSNVDFGRVNVGSAKDSIVLAILCNEGQVPVSVTSLSIDEAAFSIVDAPALPVEIGPGECIQITLRFTPSEVRSYSGVLRVESNGTPSPLAIPLAGTGDDIGSVHRTGGGAIRSVSLAPNPTAAEIQIEIELEERRRTVVTISDSRGTVIRSFDLGLKEPGRHVALWDGRDPAGKLCANGTYFVQVSTGENRLVLPVTLLR